MIKVGDIVKRKYSQSNMTGRVMYLYEKDVYTIDDKGEREYFVTKGDLKVDFPYGFSTFSEAELKIVKQKNMEIYKDIQFWVIQNIPFMSGENATIKSNIFIIVVVLIIGYVIFGNSDD